MTTQIENIKLITIIEDLPLGLILLNEDLKVLTANKIFIEAISVEKNTIINKSINSILFLPPKEHQTSLRALLNQIPDKNSQKVVLTNNQSDYFQLEFISYNDKNKQIKLFIGFLSSNNITESNLKKELNKQIIVNKTIQDELEEENELNEIKSLFFSIASHEFRTPLAGILSSLNLIDRYLEADYKTWNQIKNKEKITNHLCKINESVKNLTSILHKFLELENIEKESIPLNFTKFNLVNTLKLQCSQSQQLCKPGQKIIYTHTGKDDLIYLEKYLLKNIMNNLLSNAIKYSNNNSEIFVSSKLNLDSISIIVKDYGIGIPKSDHHKIFRRFYRSRNAHSFQDGTGLGLSIVKEYIELLNGSITFESEENIGTKFYITIPNKKI